MNFPEPTKASLMRSLRSCGAQWIKDTSEPIIGLLGSCLHYLDDKHYPHLQFGVDKGWLTSQMVGVYVTFYFTDKGVTEILQHLKLNTCAFSGRKVRGC